MKKFLVLYNSSVSAAQQMANATPEQAKAGMDAWMAWAGKAGPAIVDMGCPLGAATAFTSPTDRKPASDTLGGYSVFQAESVDALKSVLEGHPHFMAPGASIEVHEFIPLPGM